MSREGARNDKGQDTQLQMLVPMFLPLRPLRYISSSKNNLKLLITKNKKLFCYICGLSLGGGKIVRILAVMRLFEP
jgi:hypothetical protein